MRKAACRSRERTQRRPLKIDHHGLMALCFGGAHAARGSGSACRPVAGVAPLESAGIVSSNEPAVGPLMISFQMVMGHELADRFPQ